MKNKQLKKLLNTIPLINSGRTFIQNQIPYAPIVTSLPPINDPQSKDGSIVTLSSGVPANDGTYTFDGSINQWIKTANATTATVTSVDVLPHTIFTTTNPTTTPSTSLNTQSANTGLLGPVSGAAAQPAFRLYTPSDIPIPSKGVNITPVSVNANVTTEQSLMSITIPAGSFNTLNQVMRISCYGTYDIDGTVAGTMTFTLRLGGSSGLVLGTWIPSTPASLRTNMNWLLTATIVVQTIGATGALESHGFVNASQNNATAGGLLNVIGIDSNTGTVSPVDLTIAEDLLLTIKFNSGTTSNVGRQRAMIVEY